jgi:hypothetical protein
MNDNIHNLVYIYTMYFNVALSNFKKEALYTIAVWELTLLLVIYNRFGCDDFFERELIDLTTKRKINTLMKRGLIIKQKKGYCINPLYVDNIKKQNEYIYNRFLMPKYNKFLIDNQ